MSLRTSGVSFVMITLAFAQMLYFLAISLNVFGGDDGMSIAQPQRFRPRSIDLGDPHHASITSCSRVLALFFWCTGRLVDRASAWCLRGTKSNARRMTAMGFPVFRYRLAALRHLGGDVRHRRRAVGELSSSS